MPPFVPLYLGAQVELLFDLGGRTVENRLWFQSRQTSVDVIQLQALADGVADWYLSEMLPMLSDELLLTAVIATDWTIPAGGVAAASFTPTFGGSSVRSHSANVAFRIRFSNQFFRIGYWNANYVPGIPIDMVDVNEVNHDFAQNVYFAYSAIIDLAAVWGPFPAWRWLITSRVHDGAYRDEQAFTEQFTPFIPSYTVAPRRRRLPR